MQKHVNLVDLVKSFPTNIFLQNLASIQKRTSPIKFALLAEKSDKGSISNLSTKPETLAEGLGQEKIWAADVFPGLPPPLDHPTCRFPWTQLRTPRRGWSLTFAIRLSCLSYFYIFLIVSSEVMETESAVPKEDEHE